MLTDHRLQIYLPKEDYLALKKRALEEDRPLAATVREAVHAYVTRTRADRILDGYSQLQSLVGIGQDFQGKTDISERHDQYLDEIGEDERNKWRK